LIAVTFDVHQHSSYNDYTLSIDLHSRMIIFCILELQ